jgi:hypothetical protein
MWTINKEEDQNLEIHEDRAECASRQSCVALADHAYGDRLAEPRMKYPGK